MYTVTVVVFINNNTATAMRPVRIPCVIIHTSYIPIGIVQPYRGVGTIFCMGGGLFISILYYIYYYVLLI